MSAPDFERLRDAHIDALSGGLLDGVETGPDGTCYAWSRTIPDPTLNFAFGVSKPAQFAWAGAVALGRGRDPAFLARDAAEAAALRRLFEPAAVYPASWMVARARATPQLPAPLQVAEHVGARPPPAFETVFLHLSDDEPVRAHLRRHYLPALRAARARAGVAALHLVLEDGTGPAACASLYLRGGLAGLYNVSTRADRQRRGLGARITAAALAAAHRHGAREVFLQCPAGGPVERLYARAGFETRCAPILICTSRP
ncbi:GNAT family N-acetyltransferase [Methylobacterium radiodurans]|uniref:GNAT family N-acetyltransferase n=1 Tax=Methylobacterium radiodurans TaxID=2202828 RepID=A0A2U8VW77_9HYPH|nr:GNAT family N-acetyltransferase [Methylobacterium radiodurans]AWN38109.1 GNAT family N-acetyltransferase [Methylobacterium radiodurans]